jgi:CheY-like chemotaxis protein
MLSPSSSEGTILVVEDQPGLCALAEEVLSSAGHHVLVAQDGASALRVAEEYPGQIQLLLTDLSLPKVGDVEMSGQQIAALLCALRPDMKVLFTSGHPRDAVTGNGTLGPQAHFIQKPWSPRDLCQEIHTVLTTQPSSRRILVVDDEEGMPAWLTELLEEYGHQVVAAKDGLEARRLAARQSFSLMITDISMPNEEGLGIILALRKTQPGLKIIAISGANADALMDAKLLGAAAALSKPFTSEMLLKCISALED